MRGGDGNDQDGSDPEGRSRPDERHRAEPRIQSVNEHLTEKQGEGIDRKSKSSDCFTCAHVVHQERRAPVCGSAIDSTSAHESETNQDDGAPRDCRGLFAHLGRDVRCEVTTYEDLDWDHHGCTRKEECAEWNLEYSFTRRQEGTEDAGQRQPGVAGRDDRPAVSVLDGCCLHVHGGIGDAESHAEHHQGEHREPDVRREPHDDDAERDDGAKEAQDSLAAKPGSKQAGDDAAASRDDGHENEQESELTVGQIKLPHDGWRVRDQDGQTKALNDICDGRCEAGPHKHGRGLGRDHRGISAAKDSSVARSTLPAASSGGSSSWMKRFGIL